MKLPVARRNEGLAAMLDNADGGPLVFYAGARPATSDTTLSGNTVLATCTFDATAFGAPSGGVAVASSVTGDSAIDATGTCTFARAYEIDGTTIAAEYSVGDDPLADPPFDILVPTTSFVAGVALNITSLTVTLPEGT